MLASKADQERIVNFWPICLINAWSSNPRMADVASIFLSRCDPELIEKRRLTNLARIISSEFGNETAERMAVPIQTTAYVLNRVENHENYVTSVSQIVLSRTWRMTDHLEQIRYYGSSQKAVSAIVRHVGERGLGPS